MTTGEIIKNRREELQMTQEELAELVGYKHKTSINKIESGKQKIMQDKILTFAKALQFTPEQLMGWEEPVPVSEPIQMPAFTDEEIRHIKKYRTLDSNGKKVVDYILDEEFFRCRMYEEAVTFYSNKMRLPDYGYIAAAGRWVYDSDMPK